MNDHPVLRTLERELRSRGMLDSAHRVVAAVSGGPDSVALLLGLHHIASTLAADLELRVAHLDHGVRDAAGREDAGFVRALAGRIDVPAFVESLPPGALDDSHGLGFEAIARRERYGFLDRVASGWGATHVATGHTRDDQVETILMRLVRGTGLRGLRGVLRDRRLAPGSRVRLFRPLLDVSRAEILDFLAQAGEAYRVDATNVSERALRNRIRLRVLPLMKQVTGRDPAPAMARLADHATALWDFAEQQAEAWLDRHGARYADRLEFPASQILPLHPGLRPIVLAQAIARIKGNLTRIETLHFDSLLALVEDDRDATVGLPDGVLVERRGDRLRVRRPEPGPEPFAPLPVPVPGTVTLPHLGLTLEIEALDNAPGLLEKFIETKRPDEAMIDGQAAGRQLFLRCGRDGETFQPLGLDREHRLRKYLSQRKCPRALRAAFPLLATPQHVVWVVGYDLDQRVRVSPHSRLLYWIRARWSDPKFRPYPEPQPKSQTPSPKSQ